MEESDDNRGDTPRRRSLRPEPALERKRTRRTLIPRWLFELERETTHQLARYVLPWIPGTHLPYGQQLRRRLTLSHGTVAIEGLPRGWNGTRVLLLSDLHAGPFVGRRDLERTLDLLVEAAQPELILISGDLVSSRVEELSDLESVLGRLRPKLGTWAVLGNHDHYTLEPKRVLRGVESMGVPVLHNTGTRVERGGDSILLAGIDDMVMGSPDLESAIADARAGEVVVLMSHNPDIFFEAARRGVQLVVSGHTHGGQIRLPGRRPPMMASTYPFVNGHYTYTAPGQSESHLVLSEGLGVVGLPLRITCAPEAVCFDLIARQPP